MEIQKSIVDGLISDANLDIKIYTRFLKSCNNDPLKLITLLVKEGYVPRKKYGRVIGDLLGHAYLPLSETLIDHTILTQIPKDMAEQHSLIALYEINGVVSIAMSTPQDTAIITKIEDHIGKKVSPVFSFEDEIQNTISLSYITLEWLEEAADSLERGNTCKAHSNSNDPSLLSEVKEMTAFVDMMLHLAIKCHASDIHLEPQKHHLQLRFRIDGILLNKAVLSLEVLPALVSRLKALCHLETSEKRAPQEGHFDFNLPHSRVDLRASFIPSLYGTKVAIRVLGGDLYHQHLDFNSLGFSPKIQALVEKALSQPTGMILVAGPSGCGKSTSLHGLLNAMDTAGQNIMTVENPIEYHHPAITQLAVDPKAGRDYPSLLHALLRQDPDVIMVGEINDSQTAKIVTTAALSGHRVLTSLYSNHAIEVITRLINMGADTFSLASTTNGILGQRLVRRICPACLFSYQASEADLSPYFALNNVQSMPLLYQGKGCETCNFTGFHGRIAIHEFLSMTQNIRHCILRGGDPEQLNSLALSSEAFHHFYEDGFKKALMGLTTLEEITNVAPPPLQSQ